MVNSNKKRFRINLTQILLGIGKNSIVYLCLNQLAILIATGLFVHLEESNLILEAIKKFLIFIISLTELQCISMIFSRTRLGIFIGKWPKVQ